MGRFLKSDLYGGQTSMATNDGPHKTVRRFRREGVARKGISATRGNGRRPPIYSESRGRENTGRALPKHLRTPPQPSPAMASSSSSSSSTASMPRQLLAGLLRLPQRDDMARVARSIDARSRRGAGAAVDSSRRGRRARRLDETRGSAAPGALFSRQPPP